MIWPDIVDRTVFFLFLEKLVINLVQLKDIFLLLSPVAIETALITLYFLTIFPAITFRKLPSCFELAFPACLSLDVMQLAVSSLDLILELVLG